MAARGSERAGHQLLVARRLGVKVNDDDFDIRRYQGQDAIGRLPGAIHGAHKDAPQ
jgi:hypothetical protein